LTLKLPLWAPLAKGLTAKGLVSPALMEHLKNSTKDLDLKILPDLVLGTKHSLMSLGIYRHQ